MPFLTLALCSLYQLDVSALEKVPCKLLEFTGILHLPAGLKETYMNPQILDKMYFEQTFKILFL